MKIGYIAIGNVIHTRRWVSWFRDRGHDMFLVTFSRSEIDGIRNYEMFPDNDTIYMPYKGFLQYRRVRKIIREENPDILHVHYASSYGLVCALAADRPYILSTWGADIFDFPNVSPVHRGVVRYTVNKAAHITATSRMLAEGTRAFLKDKSRKIHVIPFGVDMSLFSPAGGKPERDEVVIGTVKALKPKYGIDHLIRAFSLLRKKHPHIRLTIAGRGEQEAELKALAETLGVMDVTTFAGFIDNNRIPAVIRDIDVFAVPSVYESETFGVAAVEASSCGVPVVASNIGGLPEVVEDGYNGLLAAPGNEADLAEKLEKLVLDAGLRNKMGANGIEFTRKQYQWQENAGTMEKLYQDIIDGKE